ncbi:MAG: hypothetical protein ACYC1T_09220 [Sulfuricaulis sp.]
MPVVKLETLSFKLLTIYNRYFKSGLTASLINGFKIEDYFAHDSLKDINNDFHIILHDQKFSEAFASYIYGIELLVDCLSIDAYIKKEQRHILAETLLREL